MYACVRGHARAYMFCSGVYWHTPVVCRDLAEAFFFIKKNVVRSLPPLNICCFIRHLQLQRSETIIIIVL